ncbi:hypothetical protein IGI37_002701 [Enterococcus sp. AZ194]|uniref:AraC family transcriptional regulator n=1 Tax=Enterococcus sp. AZ194 TaxID=2774629 RepID=UPI003F215772
MDIRKREGFSGERHIIVLPTSRYQTIIANLPIKETYVTKIGFFPNAKYHYAERSLGAQENILLICLDGAGTVELNNEESYRIKENEALCIPRNTPHRYFADKLAPWTVMWIHFYTPNTKLFTQDEVKIIPVFGADRMRRIQHNFSELLELADQEVSLPNLLSSANYLLLILTDVFLAKEEVIDKQNILLQKCVDYMNQNYQQELSLADLARVSNVSPSYLSAIFKKYTEKSPIDFLIHIRIEKACMYLKMTDLKLYQISDKVGYQDSFYFSRLFKKNTGKSPKKYREEMNNINPFPLN